MSLGERIETLRKEAHLSQKQLASLMNVSRQAVSKWENDLSAPDTVNLIRLADLLNTDLSYLAEGKEHFENDFSSMNSLTNNSQLMNNDNKSDKIIEIVIEKPVIKKVIRYKYIHNPLEFLIFTVLGFIAGLLISKVI